MWFWHDLIWCRKPVTFASLTREPFSLSITFFLVLNNQVKWLTRKSRPRSLSESWRQQNSNKLGDEISVEKTDPVTSRDQSSATQMIYDQTKMYQTQREEIYPYSTFYYKLCSCINLTTVYVVVHYIAASYRYNTLFAWFFQKKTKPKHTPFEQQQEIGICHTI